MITALVLLAQLARGDQLPLPAPTPPPRPRPAPEQRLDTTAYRVGLGAGGHRAAVRLAGVADPTGPEIGEITIRGQLAWRHFGMALEASAGAAASELWSDAGVGNVSLEVHWVFGGRSTHTLGLRGQLDLADRRDDPRGPIAWWGTVPVAMVPQRALTLAYAGSVAAWVWKFEVGLGDGQLGWALPSVVAGLATVQPTGGGWSVVGELEARLEPSPLHARVLMRKALNPCLGLDVGVAIPLVGMVEDPTLQVVAQLQGRW